MTVVCTVTIEGTPGDFQCGDQPVLDAAIAAGIQVPYNCRGGACGTCKAQVLEGAVEHGWVMGFAITDEERAAGKCLICASKPKTGRLVLRMLNQTTPTRDARTFVPQEYSARVVAAHNLTPAVRLLTVQLPAEQQFLFDGGMYMDLFLNGVDPPRPYSIVTAPAPDGTAPQGMISFVVARHEHGLASTRLHEDFVPGDELRLQGPYGSFRLPADSNEVLLLLAGSTGLAPLLSLATEALERGYTKPIELWFSARTRRDVFFLDELQRLAHRFSNFEFKVFITRAAVDEPLPASWRKGRLTNYLPQCGPLVRTARTLIAGSSEFVDACRAAVLACGAEAGAVLTEAYTPKLPGR